MLSLLRRVDGSLSSLEDKDIRSYLRSTPEKKNKADPQAKFHFRLAGDCLIKTLKENRHAAWLNDVRVTLSDGDQFANRSVLCALSAHWKTLIQHAVETKSMDTIVIDLKTVSNESFSQLLNLWYDESGWLDPATAVNLIFVADSQLILHDISRNLFLYLSETFNDDLCCSICGNYDTMPNDLHDFILNYLGSHMGSINTRIRQFTPHWKECIIQHKESILRNCKVDVVQLLSGLTPQL
jgi:hypothetical protein